ncbi:outer membrane protein assembly factor BamA [Treponema sp.]|uniref:outer membrane protein assembly factor BamA n=1 Tax=Treponema sp. TaxID=166 RepID=UPI00388D4222
MSFRNRRFLFTFLAVLFSVFVSAFSQESLPDGWYYDKPIKLIHFQNLKTVKHGDLDGVTSSFISKPFTDELISNLYDKLFSIDYFDDVEIKASKNSDNGKTVNLIVIVQEKPIVTKIKFTGNKALHTSDLKAKISLKKDDVYIENKLSIDERALRNYYIEKGFTKATVSASAEVKEDGVTLTFKIREGKQSVVKKINFVGNKVVSSKTLKGKVKMKEVGLFNKGAFQDASISADSRAILTYYQNRGYADSRILNVSTDSEYNEKKNREELTITFDIQEGAQYTYGGMSYVGNKVFSTEELDKLVTLRTGAIYNETKFQETKSNIQNKYYENGYTSNQFYPEQKKDADARVVSYVLHIDERPRSHIENIIIKGNEKTKDYVIRREIPIDEGDIFSNAKITNGMRNLYNLQFFSAVAPEVVQGSEENLVDVVFTVEEQSTTSLDVGFTFSGVSDPNDFPVSLFARLQDSNLWGEARSASVSTTLSTSEQSVSLGYGQNWIFGQPISGNVSVGYSHSTNYALRNKFMPSGDINNDYYYMKYKQNEFDLSTSLAKRWTPNFAIITVGGGMTNSILYNDYEDSLFVPYDSSISYYNNNWEPKNSIWTSISFDGRNISYDPSTGWFASQKLSWYGLFKKGALAFAPDWGETEFYLRSDTKAERYFTIFDHYFADKFAVKLVLMGYSSLSLQFPAPGTNIKRSNQLYIDGMFNGRGWTIYNTNKGRGHAMWSNTLELRYPVLPGILSFDLWGDAVAIKKEESELFTSLTKEDWYYSFGPSIRFCIQQFPLRLLFANTCKYRNGEFVFTNQNGDGDFNWKSNWHFVLSFNMTNR